MGLPAARLAEPQLAFPQVYRPLQAGLSAEVRSRASEILALLNGYESQKAVDPYCTCRFWASVASSEEAEPPPAELRRLLSANGFAGRASKSQPHGSLRGNLERLSV